MITFEFVYILYKSDSFTFVVNWPTIQFLNSCFSNSSLLLGVPRHSWNSKASVSRLVVGWILTIQVVPCYKNIAYRLCSDNFRWFCLFCEWSLKISEPWSIVEHILVIDIYLHDAKTMIVVKGVKIFHGMWN